MSTKFLGVSSPSSLTDGTVNVNAATLSANNLEASKALKTNSSGILVSTNLNISDINNLQTEIDSAASQWSRGGTLVVPKTSGDTVGFSIFQSEDGLSDITVNNTIDATDNIKTNQISESTTSANITMNNKTIHTGIQDTTLTASSLVETDASKNLHSVSDLSSHFSSGSGINITGTDPLTISNTYSYTPPQALGTTDSPTFAQITATDQVNSHKYYCSCGTMDIDVYNNTANSTLNISNSSGLYRADVSIEGYLKVNNNFSSPYAMSLQGTSPTDVWLEIGDTVNQNIFFGKTSAGAGASNNEFQLWNYQGSATQGHITFYTATTPSTGLQRMKIWNNGDVSIDGLTASRVLYCDTNKAIKSTTLGSNLNLTTGTLSIVASPSFTGLTLTGTTADRLVYGNASKALSSASLGSNLQLSSGTLSIVTSPSFSGTVTAGAIRGVTTGDCVISPNNNNDAILRINRTAITNTGAITFGTGGTTQWRLRENNTSTNDLSLYNFNTSTQTYSVGWANNVLNYTNLPTCSATPSSSTQLTTKAYVDGLVGGSYLTRTGTTLYPSTASDSLGFNTFYPETSTGEYTFNPNSGGGDCNLNLNRTATSDTLGITYKTGGISKYRLQTNSSEDLQLYEYAPVTNFIYTIRNTDGRFQHLTNVNMQGTLSMSTGPAIVNFVDEDNMASDSDTALPTQQSVKAYVDTKAPASSCTFGVNLTSDLANVTGDGTVYTVNWNNERYDLGSNFSGTTFTAPANGYYHFSLNIMLSGLSSGTHTSIQAQIIAAAITFEIGYTPAPSNGTHVYSGSVETYMTAGQTAYVNVRVAGSFKTVDVYGGTTGASTFSGHRFA